MSLDSKTYPLSGTSDGLIYVFNSVGKRGEVQKLIQYSPIEISGYQNVYNLGFGDFISKTEVTDTARTDNGDTYEVLTTVASTIEYFFNKYPDTSVFMSGITGSRSRLYSMAARKFWSGISNSFTIYGKKENEFVLFSSNTKFDSFLIKKK